jgi:putative membrane protein
MSEETPKVRVDLNTADVLAFERTRLAYERTMMGWIRTATSLMTFGFVLYQFFQFEAVRSGVAVHYGVLTPRRFSLALIAGSVICLAMAVVSHHLSLQAMRARGIVIPYSVAAVLGLLISILGIALYFVVYLGL